MVQLALSLCYLNTASREDGHKIFLRQFEFYQFVGKEVAFVHEMQAVGAEFWSIEFGEPVVHGVFLVCPYGDALRLQEE